MINFMFFILGIFAGIMLLIIYCALSVGGKAEKRFYEQYDNKKGDNK